MTTPGSRSRNRRRLLVVVHGRVGDGSTHVRPSDTRVPVQPLQRS